MVTMLTDQDVRDAYFAQQTARLARVEQTTPEAIIRELTNTPREAIAELAQLARGQQLLRDYFPVTGGRSVSPQISDERIVSPIIQVSAGHVGTMEVYMLVGLVQR